MTVEPAKIRHINFDRPLKGQPRPNTAFMRIIGFEPDKVDNWSVKEELILNGLSKLNRREFIRIYRTLLERAAIGNLKFNPLKNKLIEYAAIGAARSTKGNTNQ